MATSPPVRHPHYTHFAADERGERFDIGRCPDASIAACLDGHTRDNPFRISGTANSLSPDAPDRRGLPPLPTSVPLVPHTRGPRFPVFVGTVDDPASPDCRISTFLTHYKPRIPHKKVVALKSTQSSIPLSPTRRYVDPALERLRFYFPDTYIALQGDDLKRRTQFESQGTERKSVPSAASQ
jgi:hypothetical protein